MCEAELALSSCWFALGGMLVWNGKAIREKGSGDQSVGQKLNPTKHESRGNLKEKRAYEAAHPYIVDQRTCRKWTALC